MQDEKRTVYIKYFAPVNSQTANALMNAIDHKLKEGMQRLVLLISSPGGSVFHGLSIYNYLKGIPVEIITHNFGSVDSIGAVIYCAGDKRFSVPNARFLVHPVFWGVDSKTRMDEKQLEELLKSLRIDEKNIALVLARETNKKFDDIIEAIMNRTTLLPEEAKVFGLVHEIKHELIPEGAELIGINMS